MRFAWVLAAAAATVSSAGGAQSVLPPLDLSVGGPNAQAAERPLGPNAQAAQPTRGPNAAIARTSKLLGGQVHFASCASVKAVRAAPLRRGEAGYGRHLDPDGDGVACE